jgi:hypothetical protein
MNEREREIDLPPELRAALDLLPRSIEPPGDLWPGIRTNPGREGKGKDRRWWIPLSAAALVVAFALWRVMPRAPKHGRSAASRARRA